MSLKSYAPTINMQNDAFTFEPLRLALISAAVSFKALPLWNVIADLTLFLFSIRSPLWVGPLEAGGKKNLEDPLHQRK